MVSAIGQVQGVSEPEDRVMETCRRTTVNSREIDTHTDTHADKQRHGDRQELAEDDADAVRCSIYCPRRARCGLVFTGVIWVA